MQWKCVLFICFLTQITVYSESAAVKETKNTKAVDTTWWQNGVIYQVYIRSFKDDNNDGIGDIRGIINKLEYFEATGITALCLSSIYESGNIHQGRDIIDFRNVDPSYGTLDDFKELIQKAHEKGIKIIIEFIPNHTSDQHEWFQDAQYEDYYVWRAGAAVDQPPNNWLSIHGGPAWAYDQTRDKWYLHQFAKEQPDLNFHNEQVSIYIKETMTYWITLGVDGFWMSSIQYLFEDNLFRNEQQSGNENAGPEDYDYLIHDRTNNQQETYNFIYELRDFIDKHNVEENGNTRILIAEVNGNINEIVKYYGDGDIKGANLATNFLFVTDLSEVSSAEKIFTKINTWEGAMQQKYVSNWMLGNQNYDRVATRFGTHIIDAWNVLTAFLPGTMISYSGEEIGQENGQTIAYADASRTPYHWDNTKYAGFNDGSVEPWLPVSIKFLTNNLADQNRRAYKTHYNTYQKLLQLRKDSSFSNTELTFSMSIINSNVLSLLRNSPGGDTYFAIINFSDSPQTISLLNQIVGSRYLRVIIADNNSKKYNRVISVDEINLDPYESFIAKSLPVRAEGESGWWKHALIYQVYPLSFKDSNNDGVGDIQGIISKLHHLVDASVTAIWLSPIYKSPDVDQGYDISDFKGIDERFGTLEDFDELVEKAHAAGIKILLDFVPNHSSDQHEWFLQAKGNNLDYKDFYIWAKGTKANPPNNWLSYFKGSAWECDDTLQICYLHQYAKEQPDLNFRNPAVIEEMTDVLKFWLDRHVDGFRMDAIKNLFESAGQENEPLSGIPGVPENDHEYLLHPYTNNLPETYDMVYSWRDYLEDYTKEHGGNERIMITEAYTDLASTMKYYGNEERLGAHMAFNFQLITQLMSNSKAQDIRDTVTGWLDAMPNRYVANWVLGNHDNHRVATRFGPENVDGFNMLLAFLPGVMVTYNGEEIGQENGEVTWEQCKDPRACKGPEEDYQKNSRDFERTPYHWNSAVNAGFNEGAKTWLPVSKKYRNNNLGAQNVSDSDNHYNIYKKLQQLRRLPAFTDGTFDIQVLSEYTVACVRSEENGDTYVLLFNTGNEYKVVNVRGNLENVETDYIEVVVKSYRSYRIYGELIPTTQFTLDAHEGIIARINAGYSSESTETTDPDGALIAVPSLFITIVLSIFVAIANI